jgi:hypothetical protein
MALSDDDWSRRHAPARALLGRPLPRRDSPPEQARPGTGMNGPATAGHRRGRGRPWARQGGHRRGHGVSRRGRGLLSGTARTSGRPPAHGRSHGSGPSVGTGAASNSGVSLCWRMAVLPGGVQGSRGATGSCTARMHGPPLRGLWPRHSHGRPWAPAPADPFGAGAPLRGRPTARLRRGRSNEGTPGRGRIGKVGAEAPSTRPSASAASGGHDVARARCSARARAGTRTRRPAGGPWRLRPGAGSHGGSGQARRPGGPKPGARTRWAPAADAVSRRLLAHSSKVPWWRLVGTPLGGGDWNGGG